MRYACIGLFTCACSFSQLCMSKMTVKCIAHLYGKQMRITTHNTKDAFVCIVRHLNLCVGNAEMFVCIRRSNKNREVNVNITAICANGFASRSYIIQSLCVCYVRCLVGRTDRIFQQYCQT